MVSRTLTVRRSTAKGPARPFELAFGETGPPEARRPLRFHDRRPLVDGHEDEDTPCFK